MRSFVKETGIAGLMITYLPSLSVNAMSSVSTVYLLQIWPYHNKLNCINHCDNCVLTTLFCELSWNKGQLQDIINENYFTGVLCFMDNLLCRNYDRQVWDAYYFDRLAKSLQWAPFCNASWGWDFFIFFWGLNYYLNTYDWCTSVTPKSIEWPNPFKWFESNRIWSLACLFFPLFIVFIYLQAISLLLLALARPASSLKSILLIS